MKDDRPSMFRWELQPWEIAAVIAVGLAACVLAGALGFR